MSESENLELETEFEAESNPALDLINALQRGDFTGADQLFQDAIGVKVQDTLDAEKVAVAAQIFNGEEPYNDDEYEEDDVGEQVFDHMAANLMASSHKDDTISITSLDLSDKCSVCGLPAAIMQRSQCFDANCGLVK
mgnify:CR=1 FL=1